MNEKQAWRISIAFSLLLAVVLGLLWYFEDQSHNPNPEQLVDMASAERYLAENWQNKSTTDAAIYIPTGVFIQSVKFHTPDEIQITGYGASVGMTFYAFL